MNEWILICNSNYFDIRTAFENDTTITWPQKEGIIKGDIIYFYVTNPYRAILYKCQVETVEIFQMDENIKKYITNPLLYKNKQQYMSLKLLNKYPDDFLTDEKLKEYGIHNLQEAIKMPEKLSKEVNKTKKEYKFITIRHILITVILLIISGAIGREIGNWAASSRMDNETLSSRTDTQQANDIELSQKDKVTEQTTLTEDDAIDIEDLVHGTVTGNTYENNFFNLGCTLNEDWTFDTYEELSTEINDESYITDGSILEDTENTGSFFDMKATYPDGRNINVIIEYLDPDLQGIDEKTFVDLSVIYMKEYGNTRSDVSIVSVKSDQINFAGQTWPVLCLQSVYYYNDTISADCYQLQIPVRQGDYLATITFTSFYEDYTEDMSSSFYSLI